MLHNVPRRDLKYIEELRERLADAAWEFVLAGSKAKASAATKALAKKMTEIRELFIERGWLVLDKNLIPVSEVPKKLKEKFLTTGAGSE